MGGWVEERKVVRPHCPYSAGRGPVSLTKRHFKPSLANTKGSPNYKKQKNKLQCKVLNFSNGTFKVKHSWIFCFQTPCLYPHLFAS